MFNQVWVSDSHNDPSDQIKYIQQSGWFRNQIVHSIGLEYLIFDEWRYDSIDQENSIEQYQ